MLRTHHLPTKPWGKVGINLFGQSRERYVLLVDYTSDYFEYIKLASQLSVDVILSIKDVFSRLGIPSVFHTDNASNFTSAEFENFSEKWKFTHNQQPPLPSIER